MSFRASAYLLIRAPKSVALQFSLAICFLALHYYNYYTWTFASGLSCSFAARPMGGYNIWFIGWPAGFELNDSSGMRGTFFPCFSAVRGIWEGRGVWILC